jgi:cytochrome P450
VKAKAAKPPVVRSSPRVLRSLFDRRRSIAMFEAVASRYPDLAEIHIAGRKLWLVSDAALAREVLVDHGRSVSKGEGLRVVQWVLGNGILTNEDPVSHRRNRRLIQPAFSTSRLRAYSEVMVAAAMRADERWQDGEVVEIVDEMGRITLDVVGRALLGDETDQDAPAVIDALGVVIKHFGLGFVPGAAKLMDTRLPAAVRIRAAIAAMRATVARIVSEHRADPTLTGDMVASLLAASEAGESLDVEQVRDETLTLMLAGFETTANALSWTWWLLDRAPEAAAQLRAEIEAVLGDGNASYDDLRRLPYAMAVIAETLRLRPPAWMIEREVREPIAVGQFIAPVGTTMLTSPWILHHDLRSWGADVMTFRPDRWINADGAFDPTAPGQPKGAYLPFGAGSRICIGESFAWAEAVLVLVTLARRWAPEVESGQRVGMWAAVTLRPHPGIRMRLRRAEAAATVDA